MMSLINKIINLFKLNKTTEKPKKEENKEKIYNEKEEEKETLDEKEIEILSIWDIIKCNEHTQAYHLVSVIPFDEWIDMFEIKRRIWDLFQIEYKNDRSLYPYLKTMVDLGLIETNNIGGKRKWRKKDLLIESSKKKEKEKISIEELAKMTE
jgi:hypothetical protein